MTAGATRQAPGAGRMVLILLGRERGLLLGWAAGLAIYFLIIGWSYLTVLEHTRGLDQLWEALPESLRNAFGDAQSITTPGGYFEARGTSLLPIVLGGALAAQALRRLSGAEQAGELDHVLSLPVRRRTYLWSHYAVGVLHTLAWLGAAAVGGVVGMALAGMDADVLARIAFMVAETLPLTLALHSGAFLAGAALHRRAPGTAIVAAALAAFFLVQVVSSLSDATAWLRWLSPYALWVRGDPFDYSSDPWGLAYALVLLAACLPLAHRVWTRKDLTG